MALPTTLPVREYDKFTLNSSSETAVRIVGEVEITSGGSTGNKWRESYIGASVVGAETTAFSFTVGVSLARNLSCLSASSNRRCLIKLKKGATTIATGRLGAGVYNLSLNLSSYEQILSGETITVTFEGFDVASDLEIFLTGVEV
jgi:hypothetical protein